MRCAVCAAAKAQNFSSRVTVVTNLLARLKSGAHNRPDNTATRCGAGKLCKATASSFAKSRRSNASTSFSKGNFEIISNARLARRESPARTCYFCLSGGWITRLIGPGFQLHGGKLANSEITDIDSGKDGRVIS